MTALGDHLLGARAAARKLLIPYFVAGAPDREGFSACLAAADGAADAIEIGLPYSDPLMDGPVIAAAAEGALAGGTGPSAALALAAAGTGPPRIAMTYYNPVHHMGEAEFCRRAAAAGLTGIIVPDLPLEESSPLRAAAAAEGLAWVSLVAPTSPRARVEALAGAATGFVYAVSTLGVTGLRESLSEAAAGVVAACRRATDLPVVLGIGISNAEQAAAAAEVADGVVIGTAVVRLAAEGGPGAVAEFLTGVRAAIDAR